MVPVGSWCLDKANIFGFEEHKYHGEKAKATIAPLLVLLNEAGRKCGVELILHRQADRVKRILSRCYCL